MRVLMLGWEFPPFYAGGVGIVCHEMAKSLSNFNNVSVTYVMPYGPEEKNVFGNFKIMSANLKGVINRDKMNIVKVPGAFYAYDSQCTYYRRFQNWLRQSELFGGAEKNLKQVYSENLIEEVYLYAQRVANLFSNGDFDVIHAHDWTTIPAALLLKKITGKPVVLHVHITEYDKTGGLGYNPDIYKIEKEGVNGADILIAISHWIENRLLHQYGADPSKIRIVHNGGSGDLVPTLVKDEIKKNGEKLVLYAGRITMQKGIEFFIKAAKQVLEYEPNTKFVIAGSGDLLPKMIDLAADLNIGKNILFYGFYTREEANRLFSSADVFVMPSVSEPFGIVPLEAVAKGTPTIISKQSGISEVLDNTFKVDFWDVEEIAHKIITLLRYKPLNDHMRESAHYELEKFSWNKPVEKIVGIYHDVSKA